MVPLDRPRTAASRRAIWLWLALLALVTMPLAQALPRAVTVDVPYCGAALPDSGHGPSHGPGHTHVQLVFEAGAATGGTPGAGPAAPGGLGARRPEPVRFLLPAGNPGPRHVAALRAHAPPHAPPTVVC